MIQFERTIDPDRKISMEFQFSNATHISENLSITNAIRVPSTRPIEGNRSPYRSPEFFEPNPQTLIHHTLTMARGRKTPLGIV